MRRILGPVLLSGGFAALLSGQSNSVVKGARAVLDAKCVSCHGEARMSDLDFRELGTILKGGKRGPAVVPGNAEASLLYKAVKRDGELQMPPGKTPLSTSEVTALRDWINAGAHWESTAGAVPAAPSRWSFKKPVRPPVPAVKNAGWVRNPIDAFILAKLDQNGLRPAP